MDILAFLIFFQICICLTYVLIRNFFLDFLPDFDFSTRFKIFKKELKKENHYLSQGKEELQGSFT